MSIVGRTIVIRSQADAIRHLRAISSRTRDIKQPVDIRFEGWPCLHVNVKGPRYNSTLPTPLMQALLGYQDAINRVYAAAVYDGGTSRLTVADRSDLELTFKVEKGSTDNSAPLTEPLNKLVDGLVNKLSPAQLIGTVLGIALIAAGFFAFEGHLGNDLELKKTQIQASQDTSKAKHQHEVIMALIKQNGDASRALAEFQMADDALVRSVPDAKKVSVGKRSLNEGQIGRLTEKQRTASDVQFLTGSYGVEQIKHFEDDDRWSVELVAIRDGQKFKADLHGVERASELIDQLGVALTKGSPVELTLKLRMKGGVVSSARILPNDDVKLLAQQSVAD